jgi:hypothetical protein
MHWLEEEDEGLYPSPRYPEANPKVQSNPERIPVKSLIYLYLDRNTDPLLPWLNSRYLLESSEHGRLRHLSLRPRNKNAVVDGETRDANRR